MGMRVYISTNGNDAAKFDILGYTEADAAAVRAIEAEYRPILDDQMRDDWSAQYDAYTAKLNATPALSVASEYAAFGFGKLQAHKAVEHITRDQGCGGCSGELAIDVLESQKLRFEVGDPMMSALERAIEGVRAGIVSEVYWT